MRRTILSYVLAASVTPLLALTPELIFKDTFNTSANTMDVNFENAKRQTGSAGLVTYTANPTDSDQVQLNNSDSPGRLRLQGTGGVNVAYVSPNRSFTDGGQFAIEFDVDAGIDDTASSSSDWCAIVFGASSQNVFVNGSDGMGILFRNNGNIEVWDGGANAYGGSADFTGGIPKTNVHVRIEASVKDFKGSPATIKMFINDKQARINNGEALEYVKSSGFKANYITLEGAAFGGTAWTHTFDNLTVSAVPFIKVAPQNISKVAGLVSEPISVILPAQVNAAAAAQVTVRSENPTIAKPVGANASGVLTLTFPAGSTAPQTFTISAQAPGITRMIVEGPAGTLTDGAVQVAVTSGPGIPELVFQDSFDTSANSFDVNFENNKRQKGTAGVLNYAEGDNSIAGGPSDEFTQVSNNDFLGKLLIINQGTGVSPDHNFTEGTDFTIEFEVNPGANNPDRTSDNWAAIVFGATARNKFVNASDGMGILFRNDGRIQVFDGTASVYGSTLDKALPAGALNVRIHAKTANFLGTAPATIELFVNNAPVQIGSGTNLTYVKQSGFRANYITLAGIGDNLYHVFDDLKINADALINFQTTRIDAAPGGQQSVLIQVPAGLVATNGGQVKVTSRNPAVATLQGATNGVLTLNFAKGGVLTQAVNIQVLGRGRVFFDLSSPAGIGVGDPLVVSILTGLVKNPSFENNPPTAYPTYGPIDSWDGGTGVNNKSGPFHDNGAIPDGLQVAHLQGTKTISQTINGLIPGKKYWVQIRYNVRNCCGGFNMDFTVRFEGQDLESVTGIQPVGGSNPYYFRSFTFTAPASSGLLEIAGTATGDATLLLDAVTIVQRDDGNVTLQNPSFEASGEPLAPGYMTSMSGWTGTGQFGVNVSGGGPFAENGTNPDQDFVAFLQGTSSISQNLVGLLNGKTYKVSYAVNARNGNTPTLRVKANGALIQEVAVTPVGGAANYSTRNVSFVATNSTVTLTFEQAAAGDQTVLLDDIRVEGQAVNLPCIEISPKDFETGVGGTNSQVSIKIPAALTATSAAQVVIKSQNPAVAVPVGAAADGSLTVQFDPGGELTKTFNIRGMSKGSTKLDVTSTQGVCVNNASISVAVSGSFVRNPSFEANYNSTFPGYSPINAWDREGGGNTGVNEASGPFHDNGVIPDRGRVALIQVSETIRQSIVGLTPGKDYWVQFWYNTRNCCGGTIDLAVRFGGVELTNIAALTPVGSGNPYNFASIPFKATAASGDLEFATTASGDATALLDAVTIVQRDSGNVVLVNPSFEASGVVAFPGYIQPKPIAGWTGTGNYGVNVVGPGPFADNGTGPDQDSAAFIQGAASLSQGITDLTPGKTYTLSYAYNARSGNKPTLKVSLGSNVVQEESVTPVGAANPWYIKQVVFTASDAAPVLKFEQTATGDNTVVIDDVRITEGAAAVPVPLKVARIAGNQVTISWPSTATGYVLQSTAALPGGWQNVTPAPQITVVGPDNVVTITPSGGRRFYRLLK